MNFTVPDGFTIETAAEPPLVGYPMMACFDERGRLFIAEAAGTNGTMDVLERLQPNFIRMLEDTNGDGKFDKSTIFADKLQIPNGALWHKGSLYVAEPPGIWRYTDTNDDGVADVREHIAGKVKSNGMSSTLHGPVLGPTGVLFWCGGQSGYALDKDGTAPNYRITPGVFTLRTDGSEHEVFSVGGLANPVEVTFSPEGEVFGTVDILDRPEGARHDALMHWVYGGTYNVNANDKNPLKRTGDYLPPLSHVGQVAPAGLTSYRGTQWGDEFRNNIFWAQFNTFKVVRTQIERHGATFKSQDEDFLVADNVDVHFTDVLEDADGSLLVINTGGWFRHGCPTSQIAKPEVKGGIYRIRRTDSKPVEDARGLKINWAKLKERELCDLLTDSRLVVEERAISTLADRGKKAVSELKNILSSSKSVQARRNAVWSLSRMNAAPATAVIRRALNDTNSSVRQSAVHALGMLRDGESVAALSKIVVEDAEASIRREAATALGRTGKAEAVPHLLKALRSQNDRFLEHSLIYALIQIGEPKKTEAGLADSNDRVRRGALIALNQMDGAQLSREQIAPMLSSRDFELRKAAFQIAVKNPEWSGDIASAIHDWIQQASTEDELSFLGEAISSQAADDSVQRVVSETLLNDATPEPVLLTLLESIRRHNPKAKQFPQPWSKAVEHRLHKGTLESRLAAVAVVRDRGLNQFDNLLKQLVKTEKRPKLRIAFISILAPRLSPVDEESFSLLMANVQGEASPLLRLDAARTMTSLKLSEQQLTTLAGALSQVDPLALPTLLQSFARNTNDLVGLALISGLEKAPAAANLSSDELARIFNKFSSTVVFAAQSLLKKLGADLEEQEKHIEQLLAGMSGGDFSRGKTVFFGKQAACSACHRVSGQGGLAGPNLSQIGKIRNERDLLESIIYPSASIVQGYHPYTIETENDFVYSGIITRQTPDAVWIRGTDLVETKVEQKQIKSMTESSLSTMPQGLADSLTQEQLQDLMAFLRNLK
ncbi:MAG: HEAT repeat domain-containing protein [Verrucomicrobia bacterium]|nr:HEAT repeat domain-containing protein [Verrucomicrobiota bacterium]